MPSQQANLLLQTYFTFSLLVELRNNKFLESTEFDEMRFGSPWIKNTLKEIGIDNQGCAVIALYVMLALPKKIIETQYPNEYDKIEKFVKSKARITRDDYKDNTKCIHHIRNAVAHGRVAFRPQEVIILHDERCGKKKREHFTMEIPLVEMGTLLQCLQEVHLQYIRDLQAEH